MIKEWRLTCVPVFNSVSNNQEQIYILQRDIIGILILAWSSWWRRGPARGSLKILSNRKEKLRAPLNFIENRLRHWSCFQSCWATSCIYSRKRMESELPLSFQSSAKLLGGECWAGSLLMYYRPESDKSFDHHDLWSLILHPWSLIPDARLVKIQKGRLRIRHGRKKARLCSNSFSYPFLLFAFIRTFICIQAVLNNGCRCLFDFLVQEENSSFTRRLPDSDLGSSAGDILVVLVLVLVVLCPALSIS